jgi:hypothetical protein
MGVVASSAILLQIFCIRSAVDVRHNRERHLHRLHGSPHVVAQDPLPTADAFSIAACRCIPDDWTPTFEAQSLAFFRDCIVAFRQCLEL